MRPRNRRRGSTVSPDIAEPSKPPLNAINWRRLFAYLKPYPGRIALAVGALLLASAAQLAFPLLIVRLLESVLQSGNGAQLNTLTIGLVALFLFQSAATFVQTYNLNYIGERVVRDLRAQLYRRFHALSLDFFANRRTGELVSRISNDVTQVREVLTTNLTRALTNAVSLVGSIIIVFTLNPRLVGFVLVLALAILIVATLFGRRFQGLGAKVQDELAGATATVEEGLQGIRVVKSFVREDYEIGRYEGAMQRVLDASLKLAVFRSAFGSLMAFMGFAALAVVLWFSGAEVLAGRLAFSTISGFLIYAITIAANLGVLAELYRSFREALGGVQRVFEILDTAPAVADAANASELPRVTGRVQFEGVSFAYEKETPRVLDDVSIDIAPGEIVALVGPSGAGKSTLFNLIPRFYDPTCGRVLIDGVDLRTVTQRSVRSQIGLVPQETVLFSGSIKENIAYGRLDASEAEIMAAARAANAHDFILATVDGYDSRVGERGIKLSGGQRQRVAIARAILKDPRILLLDEATSSLDSESEELVQDALNRLMQGRTSIIIAHRLSTIKIAHRILVLEGGRIVEQGPHDALMAIPDGLYARLYSMQFRLDAA